VSPESASSLDAVLDAALGTRGPALSHLAKILAKGRGHHAGADAVARQLGLRNRHQLLRALRKEHLPNLTELAAWTRLLDWRITVEETHRSLLSLTLDEVSDPAERYRTTLRLTGVAWTDVRHRDLAWLAGRFVKRMQGPYL
jgi:DNA-binding phage protein